jgi:hypothetical protein
LLASEFTIAKDTLSQSLILPLKTPQNNEAWNHPENTRVTHIDELLKLWVFLTSSLNNGIAGYYLTLLILLKEITLTLLPGILVLLKRCNQLRIIFQLRVNHIDVLSKKTENRPYPFPTLSNTFSQQTN